MITSSSELLNPELPEKLDRVQIPVVEATDESLKGFGCLVEKQEDQEIEIVRWPHQGWREVDPDTGNEGGTTEGIFEGEWKGDVLYGSNQAVSGNYTLGYAVDPEQSDETHQRDPEHLLLWHANYHPDGGQLFSPWIKTPFSAPSPSRETMSSPRISSLSSATEARVSTSIPTSGMKEFSRSRANSVFSTSRGRCTRGSRSILPGNSTACWKSRFRFKVDRMLAE